MTIKRTKLVDKNIYVKWYDIAKDEINNSDLIPDRKKEEIFSLISQENWLLFCPDKIPKEEAILRPDPNIFFDILSKEGNLIGQGRLGLCFNNLGAYNKFETIMKGPNRAIKENITKKLLELKYPWKIYVKRKIKSHNYAQTPEYIDEGVWDSKLIDENIINEIIGKAKLIREQGINNRELERSKSGNPKKFYTETPSINLMEADFSLNEEEFRDRITEIFSVLVLCLSVKRNVEVNKINREKIKKLEELKKEIRFLKEDRIPKMESLKGIMFREEEVNEIKSELSQKEKEAEQIETELN